MELTGKILDVSGRKVTTKFGEKEVFDVQFSDGNTYGTFKEPLAAEARRAMGLEAITIKVEQNGDFVNFAGVASLTTNGDGPTSQQEAFSREVSVQQGSGATPSLKDVRIARMAAGKVAATFPSVWDSGSLETQMGRFRELVLEIEKFYLEAGVPEGPEWQEQ